MVAVLVRCEESLELAGTDGRDVLFCERQPEAILTDATNVAAGGFLGLEEDAKVDRGRLQHSGKITRRLLNTLVERGVVAHEPEVLCRLSADVFRWR